MHVGSPALNSELTPEGTRKLPTPTSPHGTIPPSPSLSQSLFLSLSMENSRLKPEAQTLSPSSSGRRSSDSNSPDFEFWMVRNPSFPQPNLLSADELFVDGVLLPLHLLPYHHSDPPDTLPQPNSKPPIANSESDPLNLEPEREPGSGPEISAVRPESTTLSTASKRWKDIFKKRDKKTHEDKEKEKKKERKSQSGASTSAELNINIWPFSRSRSAGNNVPRPKMVAGAQGSRKVSSAPCSRSNSAGESKSRKWPSSPGRPGVHLGRSSPVWQVRRGASGAKTSEPVVRNAEKGIKKEGMDSRRSKVAVGGGSAKARVLNLNVPMCIGYRHHLSCRSDENSAIGAVGGDAGSGGKVGGGGAQSSSGGASNVGGGGNLFNLRGFFTKKVY